MEEILQKYNGDKESKQKLERELNMAKMHKEKDEERLEEAINEFGEHTMDDYGSAVIQSYKEKIQTDASEIEKIEKNINEADDNISKIATDRNIQAMTIGIEKIEKEIKVKNIELSKKEIELQEFYLKDDTEGKLAQDFYNELDNIKKEISDLESKKQQYEELLNVAKEIRDEFIKDGKYNELNKEDIVIESEETKPAEAKTTEETKTAEVKEEAKEEAPKTTEETKPEEVKTTEGKKSVETKPATAKTKVETKPATVKSTKKAPGKKEPEGLQIKEIKIGEEIIIKYDTITLKERKLDFKQVKSNLEKTAEDKKEALNEIMGADIEWTEEQLDGVDYNMLSALKEVRKDGVTKKTAKEILTSYMGAIAGKEEAKQKTKSILTYDRKGMDLLKPSNLFKYMVRKKAYTKIKENSDNANEFSKVEVDELGFFRRLLYKNKQLKIEGKKFPREADKNRIKQNMEEYYNGQKTQEETKLRDREDIKVDDKVKDDIQNAVSQFYRDMNKPAYDIKMNSKLREASNEKGLDNNNDTKQNADDHEKAIQAVEAYKKQIADKEEGR